ncbi:mitochondrial carrier [Cantharellus anzutake]|uniref:mitochondrial carrier n=1 Tax=Cantharellus anzutake TaxID=1750568 RepID=UPI00190413DE|nr:mitochondrial carrier [Cantharellus anzutake]KAF8310060.1 mitochondrial carrier [Cantharellus anzutake]
MSSVIHATSGAAAGIFAMTLTYPLIFLSTRAAVQVRGKDKSTYEAIIDIIKSEGVEGMYSGLTVHCLGLASQMGRRAHHNSYSWSLTRNVLRVYYYFYEKSREIILKGREKGVSQALTTPESMLAGLIAGSATTAISNPIWVVQTTQAVQTVQEESSLPTSPGIGAFWRGIGPALVLVINPIIQYTIFEQLKNWLIARRTARLREQTGLSRVVAVLSDLDFFFLGAVSKLGTSSSESCWIVFSDSSTLSSNHDYSRSRLCSSYKSSIDGILTVIKEEGVSGLYKGVGVSSCSRLTAAILFAGQKRIYETTRAALTSVPVKR